MNLLQRIGAKPNLSRFLFDFALALTAAVFVVVFTAMFMPEHMTYLLLGAPLVLLGVAWAIGIYGRLGTATGAAKAYGLTLAVALTGLILALFTRDVASVVLWCALTWVPLILPRLFLNINRKEKYSVLQTAIKNRGPVLVVGGAGYIGSHVVDQLIKGGSSVRVLDRLTYGKEPIQEFLGNPRFEFIEGDATDIVKLNLAMNGVSAVVHLAGLVGDPACAVDETFTRHTNVVATRMVREVATSLGVPRFIFASSCSVYGISDNPVNEASPLNPVSLYARTKIDSETELLSVQPEDFCVTVLRFATVFGHSRRPRFDLVVNLFTAQAFVDGRITVAGPHQWRPFVHVRDLARAVVTVLKAPEDKVRGEVFNIGDGRLNMTIGQLADTAQRVVSADRPVEIVVNTDWKDNRNYMVSFDKVKNVLGFQSETDIEQGISEMVAEFKKGSYNSYKAPSYSNLEMTKVALSDFRDPELRTRLYSPMGGA